MGWRTTETNLKGGREEGRKGGGEGRNEERREKKKRIEIFSKNRF